LILLDKSYGIVDLFASPVARGMCRKNQCLLAIHFVSKAKIITRFAGADKSRRFVPRSIVSDI